MKIDRPFEYKRFSQAKAGALMIAVYGGLHVVRGIKTVFVDDDGKRQEYFVTVGPFVPKERGYVGPTSYTPDVIAPGWVLELSSDHMIVPSTELEDLSDGPLNDDAIRGSLIFGEDGVYLGAVHGTGEVLRPRVKLWDIATGHHFPRPQ